MKTADLIYGTIIPEMQEKLELLDSISPKLFLYFSLQAAAIPYRNKM
jgi:hypothetical protein